jgi:predicted amidohydrolase
MKYKVGVCQFKPELLNYGKNLEVMIEMVENVNADLIVFPELATSGYLFSNQNEVNEIAEDFKNSKTIKAFLELSKKNNCSYVIGLPEKSNSKIYNSSVLINPDGKYFTYRKTHLFYEEKKWFEPGNTGFNVFEAKEGVKVGLMICFDWMFPESARSLMLNGAQIIAHSANLVLPWCQQAMLTRSLENSVFSITANRTGKDIIKNKELFFTGQSQVVDTKGNLLFRMNEVVEKIEIIEIDPNVSNNKDINEFNNLINDRITKYYK